MLSSVACKIIGHRIDRKRVWHDSIDFRTSCTRCHAQMLRGFEGWREFVDAKDDDIHRKPHPRTEAA
jgi:hypothetical protein